MNIKAIFTSDDNPLYKDFAEIVSLAWKKVGFIPHFLNISSFGEMFCPANQVPLGNQAQILRVMIPALFPDDIFITADVDMLPLSRSYFQTAVQLLERENEIINLSADAYGEFSRFPICYYIAKGKTFSSITGIRDEQDISQALSDWWIMGHGWNTDETVFGQLLRKAEAQGKIIFRPMARGWSNGIASQRIDRADWRFDRKLLQSQQYIDSHMVRPLSKHRWKLRPLFKYIHAL